MLKNLQVTKVQILFEVAFQLLCSKLSQVHCKPLHCYTSSRNHPARETWASLYWSQLDCFHTRSVTAPPCMGCQLITRLLLAFHQASLKIWQYLFILLGGKRLYGSEVFCPKTQQHASSGSRTQTSQLGVQHTDHSRSSCLLHKRSTFIKNNKFQFWQTCTTESISQTLFFLLTLNCSIER